MISTGWGAGRRTDRLSDGIKALQLRERPLAAVPLLPLYRKTRAGVDYFIGGGAGRACMNDLVVDRWVADGEGGSHHDFRFRHDVWTMLFHQIGERITSILSIAWYFTTK